MFVQSSALQSNQAVGDPNRLQGGARLEDSEFEDLYNEIESNYVELNTTVNINYVKFYEDLQLRKWERVISEENVDDEECKESQASNRFQGPRSDPLAYNKIIYTPRTGHAVVEHGGLFYLFAGADSDSRTNDMYQFNPVTKQWHQILQATGDSHINSQMN